MEKASPGEGKNKEKDKKRRVKDSEENHE